MVKISKNYKPTKKEKFMNSKMKEYFRLKLINWKKELLKESSLTLNNLQNDENRSKPDITDMANEEIERSFELRTRDRERKLISKIEAALKRIEDGSYGYCEETGEPIEIKRLEARLEQGNINELILATIIALTAVLDIGSPKPVACDLIRFTCKSCKCSLEILVSTKDPKPVLIP